MTDVSQTDSAKRGTLASGEAVELRAFSNNVLCLFSPKAFPPGAPVAVRWSTHALQGRSIGSKREDEGVFSVRIRMVSLTRVQRDALIEKAETW